ncbi:hypothetical protein Rsub_04043 [Raphidocelis subcapitata]|uniref:Acid phosphatase n=1 Tax=Raphidocelis subcapitata TaxID=307507 RepID=A0A2V0NWM5_9CHLO|nr:hypothetical protein Rsub_04043 [Raphidocelis subcapitata]|eukprot:GBF91739.1 hypothetical protein Rsub_04043 [Raphidocelis subcapitata]
MPPLPSIDETREALLGAPPLAARHGAGGRRARLGPRAIAEVLLAVTAVAALASTWDLRANGAGAGAGGGGGGGTADAAACFDPACQHALGGGRIASGGDFPHLDPAGCKAQLSAYITSGQYLSEVNASIASAFDALGLPRAGGRTGAPPPVKGDPSRLVVFDIDETALSNIVEFEAPNSGGGGRGGARLRAGFAGRGGVEEWAARVAANAASPALQPTLELYQALCAAGIPVAFVTGRSEPARAATRANLASAGYGARCTNATAAGAAAPPASGGPCCYVDLILRAPGDGRLASVYKPWARAQLAARGYEIWASVGDQFSDLSGGEGPSNPEYAFKITNPFYFIL